MPKTSKIRRNCRAEIEWLEPASDKGRRSIVRAKKIIGYQKGLQNDQTIFCSWRSRKYKAIVRRMIDQSNGANEEHQLDQVRRDEEQPDDDAIVHDVRNTLDVSLNDEHQIASMSVEIQTETPTPNHEAHRAKANSEIRETIFASVEIQTETPTPNHEAYCAATNSEMRDTTFVSTTSSQTDGIYVTQNSIYEIQAQLASLVGQLAIMRMEMKQMKDVIACQQVSTPLTPCTPQTPRSEGNNVPLYGKMVEGVVKLEVLNGSVGEINIPKKDYDRIFYNARTATSFLRQLLPIAFGKNELAVSNFEGGKVVSSQGFLVKETLERARMAALMRTVEMEFPGSTVGKDNMARLREAVNDRCRFASRQMKF